MFTKITLSLAVLALVVATGVAAQERHYDKATVASLNRDNDARMSQSQPATQSAEVYVRHYDKATVASLNREADARVDAAAHTQRAQAANVSFNCNAPGASGYAVEYTPPQRSSAYKPTYYSINAK